MPQQSENESHAEEVKVSLASLELIKSKMTQSSNLEKVQERNTTDDGLIKVILIENQSMRQSVDLTR
jgi:hypothetical protein